ncbi:hypothetical protein BKA69DRAFT_469011 [Paraphysoderma sedebokerense]|nr:hypothetical protein BKA69DRAFT_469011 [Paraphysoderma sedebokerense]
MRGTLSSRIRSSVSHRNPSLPSRNVSNSLETNKTVTKPAAFNSNVRRASLFVRNGVNAPSAQRSVLNTTSKNLMRNSVQNHGAKQYSQSQSQSHDSRNVPIGNDFDNFEFTKSSRNLLAILGSSTSEDIDQTLRKTTKAAKTAEVRRHTTLLRTMNPEREAKRASIYGGPVRIKRKPRPLHPSNINEDPNSNLTFHNSSAISKAMPFSSQPSCIPDVEEQRINSNIFTPKRKPVVSTDYQIPIDKSLNLENVPPNQKSTLFTPKRVLVHSNISKSNMNLTSSQYKQSEIQSFEVRNISDISKSNTCTLKSAETQIEPEICRNTKSEVDNKKGQALDQSGGKMNTEASRGSISPTLKMSRKEKFGATEVALTKAAKLSHDILNSINTENPAAEVANLPERGVSHGCLEPSINKADLKEAQTQLQANSAHLAQANAVKVGSAENKPSNRIRESPRSPAASNKPPIRPSPTDIDFHINLDDIFTSEIHLSTEFDVTKFELSRGSPTVALEETTKIVSSSSRGSDLERSKVLLDGTIEIENLGLEDLTRLEEELRKRVEEQERYLKSDV